MPSVALNIKPGHIIFGIQLMRRKFLAFKTKALNYKQLQTVRAQEWALLFANNSCKAPLGQTAASVCKPYLGVDQDQQYKITLIELKVLQILSFALIWPTQLCAVHGTVLGGYWTGL